MKRAPRAAIAALITATAAALLPLSVPALASPVPPSPNAALFGTWRNANPATRNVVDIVIAGSKKRIAVDGFGACTPTPCEWGNIPGTVFGANVSVTTGRIGSVSGRTFLAPYRFSFAKKLMNGTLNKAGTVLTVRTYTEFTDHSGRSNYVLTETFTRRR